MRLTKYSIIYLLVLLLISNTSEASLKPEVINIAYYKLPPHFIDLKVRNNIQGPVYDYLTKVIAPLMQVQFNFKMQLPIDMIDNIPKSANIHMVLGVLKNRPDIRVYSTMPFYKSYGIILVKHKYNSKITPDWSLGHYPTSKEKVIPFIRKLSSNIFFLSPTNWIYRGVKMLKAERIFGLLDLDKLGSSYEVSKLKNSSQFSCIDLPMGPISFHIAFPLHSASYTSLLKRYNQAVSKAKLTYNEYLDNYLKKQEFQHLKCKYKLNYLSKK